MVEWILMKLANSAIASSGRVQKLPQSTWYDKTQHLQFDIPSSLINAHQSVPGPMDPVTAIVVLQGQQKTACESTWPSIAS